MNAAKDEVLRILRLELALEAQRSGRVASGSE